MLRVLSKRSPVGCDCGHRCCNDATSALRITWRIREEGMGRDLLRRCLRQGGPSVGPRFSRRSLVVPCTNPRCSPRGQSWNSRPLPPPVKKRLFGMAYHNTLSTICFNRIPLCRYFFLSSLLIPLVQCNCGGAFIMLLAYNYCITPLVCGTYITACTISGSGILHVIFGCGNKTERFFNMQLCKICKLV